MTLTIDELLEEILDSEGREYTNDPDDRGGPTKYGITLATLRLHLGNPFIEADQVENLSEEMAKIIYTDRYIKRPGYWGINSDALKASVIDFSVNSGVSRASKYLQTLVGVRVDGDVGPRTCAAINALSDEQLVRLNIDLNKARLEFLAKLVRNDPSQSKYIYGWIHRVNKLY